MVKKCIIAVLLAAIWLASSWTLFKPGFFQIHDFVHGARIGEMALALQDGHFPVRWSQNFGYGYGMPLYEFYAPLPYYVGAGLFWLGLDLVLVLKILFGGCSLLTLLGAYLMGKELSGRMGGIIAAALLTLAPYRALNMYIRGALSEAWGLMALPWILVGIVLVIKRRSSGWIILTLGLVTLFLSHNLTTLMFVPLSGLFGMGYLVSEMVGQRQQLKKYLRPIGQLVGSYLLAIGLSAFYLIPAVMEKQLTKVDTIISGYFNYQLHFLYLRQFFRPGWGFGGSEWGPNDAISFFFGWSQWVSLIVLGGAMCWYVIQKWRVGRLPMRSRIHLFQGLMALVLAGVALFMTIGKSQPIWDSIGMLAYIQFPWRWLSSALVFLTAASTYLVFFVPDRRARLIVMASIVITSIGFNARLFQPERYLDEPVSLYYTEPARIQAHMSNVLQDYIPAQMAPKLDENPEPPIQLIMNPDQTGVETVLTRVHEKLIKTNLPNPTTLELAIADYPGWYAEIDGQPASLMQTQRGNLQIDVPAGEHLIGLKFGSTPVRYVSDLISAGSWLLFLFAVLPRRQGHEKIEKHD